MRVVIQFRAFIPKSIGKSMLSYFSNDYRVRGGLVNNRDSFLKALKKCDEAEHNWIKEPAGPTSMNCYAATDGTEIGEFKKRSTYRLGLNCEIDTRKIGAYSQNDADKIFIHKSHHGAKNETQHSSQSHRVKAYIDRIPFHGEVPKPSQYDIYRGVCEPSAPLTSEEKPLNCIIVSRNYSKLSKDAYGKYTYINVSASANYPYVYLSPNIDFILKIAIAKPSKSNSYGFHISGTHNLFPAYELIVDGKRLYYYDPSVEGEDGPGLINLNSSSAFSVRYRKKN